MWYYALRSVIMDFDPEDDILVFSSPTARKEFLDTTLSWTAVRSTYRIKGLSVGQWIRDEVQDPFVIPTPDDIKAEIIARIRDAGGFGDTSTWSTVYNQDCQSWVRENWLGDYTRYISYSTAFDLDNILCDYLRAIEDEVLDMGHGVPEPYSLVIDSNELIAHVFLEDHEVTFGDVYRDTDDTPDTINVVVLSKEDDAEKYRLTCHYADGQRVALLFDTVQAAWEWLWDNLAAFAFGGQLFDTLTVDWLGTKVELGTDWHEFTYTLPAHAERMTSEQRVEWDKTHPPFALGSAGSALFELMCVDDEVWYRPDASEVWWRVAPAPRPALMFGDPRWDDYDTTVVDADHRGNNGDRGMVPPFRIWDSTADEMLASNLYSIDEVMAAWHTRPQCRAALKHDVYVENYAHNIVMGLAQEDDDE